MIFRTVKISNDGVLYSRKQFHPNRFTFELQSYSCLLGRHEIRSSPFATSSPGAT